MFFFNISD